MDITIRPAAPADLPQLAKFIEPFVAEGRLLQRTFEELEQLLPHAFLADTGSEIVGCVALEIYSKKLAEVRSLAVAPEYRNQGIGRRLVEACLNRAREREILEVMAITSSEDFFRACGFDFTLPGEKKALFVQLRETI
jgi:N-acetylglutamate synthase-like GNAT family acetyltransferase